MFQFILSLLLVVAFAEPEGNMKPKPKPKQKGAALVNAVNANDQINLQPMRDCTQCWECYACTHDEHYGTVGNCVPIMGCEPSACYSDDECGAGRTCVQGSCQECAMSSDCSDGRTCYYGQCRDTCNDYNDCTASYSGDLCEHGMCVCAGSEC